MTKDDIIRMYEKANGWSPKEFENTIDELERFAHLVVDDTLTTMHKAIAHEREQCAKLAEGWQYLPEDNFTKQQITENLCKTIAHHIRERGKPVN